MTKKRNKGFTLLELLVVVAIIAILALLVLLALDPVEMMRKSRDSQRLSDLGTLRRAVDLALADGESLPPAGSWSTNTASLNAADKTANLVRMDISKYLANIPQDPSYKNVADTIQTSTGASCPDGVTQTARSAMVYTFKTDGSKYELTSRLESKDNCETLTKDNGNQADHYEIGTVPGLAL